MSQISEELSACNTVTNLKGFECDYCNTTYSDKAVFEMHRATHLKEITFASVKEQQSVVVMNPGTQIINQAQQQLATPLPMIIQEQDLSTYKKSYGVEPQQVYTLVPMSQYQTLSTNSRVTNVASSHDNQGNLSTFGTPMYIVVSTPDGQQLQPITEIIQQEHITSQDLSGQLIQVAPQITTTDIQTTRVPAEMQANRISIEASETQEGRIHTEIKVNKIAGNIQVPVSRITGEQMTISPKSTSRQNRIVSVKIRPFKCDQCTASFIEAVELEDHRKKHTGDGPFTCEDCHFTFMYKSHFRSHKTRCQKKRASLTKPAILNANPVKRQFPINHIKQEPRVVAVPVSLSPPKTVPITSSITPTKNQARQVSSKQQAPSKFNPNKPCFKRVKVETRSDRPYECQECDASFQSMIDLNVHRTKHTGEGPFKCDECKFVFLYRKLYEAHKRRCDKKKKEFKVTTIQDATVLAHGHSEITQQQYIIPDVNNRIYSTIPEVQIEDGSTMDVTGMQLIQPSVIEMRPVITDGQGNASQSIIEQVIVTPNNQGSRQEFKYEIIPTVDGVNVNQIINLIKVKEQ